MQHWEVAGLPRRVGVPVGDAEKLLQWILTTGEPGMNLETEGRWGEGMALFPLVKEVGEGGGWKGKEMALSLRAGLMR